MQLLDAALIVIPASFFFLMAADFVSGLVALFNSQSLNVKDAEYLLQIIDSVPQLEPHIETCIDEDSEELEDTYLPDPWVLPVAEVAIAPTATAPTAAPCLRLLPPGRPQTTTLEPAESELLATFMPIVPAAAKRGRPKKEVASAPVVAAPAKRRGRPRKSA